MEVLYTLLIDFPDGNTRKYNIIEQFTIGLDPRNDLILLDHNIKSQHFIFTNNHGVLSLHYLGRENVTSLSGMPLKTNKHYILTDGDILKTGLIKIKIIQTKNTTTPSISEKNKDIEVLKNFDMPKLKKNKIQDHISLSTLIESFPYHVYAFIIDLIFPYFILSFLLPKFSLHETSFYILKTYLDAINIPFPFIYLFTCYLVHLSSNLIFGNSIGSFLVGLEYAHNPIFSSRIRSIVLSILSPSIIPLFFTGKIPTFNTFQGLKRKILIPFFLLFILGSYFFLPDQFKTSALTMAPLKAIIIDSQSTLYQTNSKTLNLSFNHFIPNEFLISLNQNGLPIINFYDSKYNQTVHLNIFDKINVDEFYQKLYFHNPLFPILYVENKKIHQIKNDVINILKFNPSEIFDSYKKSGPFINYKSILKKMFFKYLTSMNLISIINYSPDSPILQINSENEKIFLIFTKQYIYVSRLENLTNDDIFYKLDTSFFSNLKSYDDLLNPPSNEYSFLSSIDGIFTHQDTLILTYYEALAKRIEKITDLNLKDQLYTELNRNSRWKFPRSIENENPRPSKRTLSIPTSTRRQKYKGKGRRH